MRCATLSTGVLSVVDGTDSIVVNIVNLDTRRSSYEINVEIWDWSFYDYPVPLTVLYNENEPVLLPYCLDQNHLAVFYAATALEDRDVSLYEIRITYPEDANIIANCFGRVASTSNKEGETVYHSQLIRLDKPAHPSPK